MLATANSEMTVGAVHIEGFLILSVAFEGQLAAIGESMLIISSFGGVEAAAHTKHDEQASRLEPNNANLSLSRALSAQDTLLARLLYVRWDVRRA